MRSHRRGLELQRISLVAGAAAASKRLAAAFERRPWLVIGLACLVLALLAFILAPLLSFALAAALGAGAYALLGRRGAAALGRLRMADTPAYRRMPASAPLFLDLASVALFGIGIVLLATGDAADTEALIALGLGAALVGIARAT